MIVLAILKIIGIVLLCAIALAVFLLLLVLFVPIDYCIKVKKNGEEFDAGGNVKWLFGGVGAKAWLEKKYVFYKINVFGFSIKKGKIGDKKEDTDEKIQNIGDGTCGNSEITQEQKENIGAASLDFEKWQTEQENIKEDENYTAGKPEVKIFEVEQERKRQEEDRIRQAEAEKIRAEKEKKKEEKEARKEEKKVKKSERKQKFKELLEKAKNIKSKAERIKRALDTSTGQRAKAVVKSEGFKLLRYLKPRLIKGSLVLGTDNPAKTAEIYGALSQITYLISDGKLVVQPDFDKKTIQPDITAKGRIFLYQIAAVALKVILNKDVSRLWKEIRRITNG